MKVQNALLMMLLLAIAVASCGGEDIDYESIAESFEEESLSIVELSSDFRDIKNKGDLFAFKLKTV